MKFTGIILSIGLAWAQTSLACSVISAEGLQGAWVGKNYDWDLGHGMAFSNKRNVEKKAAKTSEKSPHSVQWISRYSSLTFTQFGREFPLSGMNEKGLVVEILWLNESQYPTPDKSELPSINELQWIQYLLDTASSTEEAIEQARKVRVEPVFAKVHYLVCDEGGSCAVIEYLKGELVVVKGTELKARVLTNSIYGEALDFAKAYVGFGGDRPAPKGIGSFERFVRAGGAAKSLAPDKVSIESIHSILQSVEVTEDTNIQTRWQLIYDIANRRIAFKTQAFPSLKQFEWKQDPSCKKPVQVMDLNQAFEGQDVTDQFVDYSPELNAKLISKNIFLPKSLRELASIYPGVATRCLDE